MVETEEQALLALLEEAEKFERLSRELRESLPPGSLPAEKSESVNE
jgi:hypothetical protein